MHLEQLQALVKIVQLGGFTRAAEVLGAQKSHLSRLVTQLEAQLGVKLLERTTRSLSATEMGREVYERAIGILAAVEDTERVAQQHRGEPSGTLRLTCGVEFGLVAVVLGLLVLGLVVVKGLFWLVLATVVLVLGLLLELGLLGFSVFAKTGAGFSRNV